MDTNGGNLKISEDVIISIAKQAVAEIEGVAGLAEGAFNLRRFFRKPDEVGAPIRMSSENGAIQIDIAVVIRYGLKVREVSEEIQETIKAMVQNMVGIAVSKVNVTVANLFVVPTAKETEDGRNLS